MEFSEKNILLIIHAGSLGGAERQGLGISKILTEKYNCKVNLLLTSSGDTTKEFEDFAKECHIINTLYLDNPYLLFKKELTLINIKRLFKSISYLFNLKKGLKPYKPDIIIPFLNFPSKVAFYLYWLIPSVKFTFWHQLGLDVLSLDVLESIAAKNTSCVVANASNGLEMFKNLYIIEPQKLNILPQYISISHHPLDKEKLKLKFKIPKNSLVIGMIAHYRPEKYHELLLNVFEKLIEKHDNINLVFLGNKNNTVTTQKKYQYLSAKIVNNNMSSKVLLLSGFKVEEVLNILDIGVLVSRIEGMPNAVMEYMLYGLPVVASNHPGCVQLLSNSSFLIENNERELFDSLDKLIMSEILRISEGRINSEKIKVYDMDSYITKLQVIMNKSLKLKRILF
ncbi:glycosyltransferase [Gillisia hiemivivida]|uniref:Glycosyltransferase n=1 Tax=Gillisia hiemivivida TaxID=291190 RepID=A0A5C6ZSR4_9FLAO|nr:glycosyltransferase [Gillisia hiemivivida]TXD93887.1 glycosyltransferase [Gillisia hiemivivida]